jgi:hypothetical protein
MVAGTIIDSNDYRIVMLLPFKCLCMANYCSRCYGQVIGATAMRFPVEIAEGSAVDGGFTGEFCWCNTIKRGVSTMCVVVLSKSIQLLRKILGIPEKRLVKEFSTNGSDQPFDEGMQLMIMSCCFMSRLSATTALASPGPRSLAMVVSKWERSMSGSFMAEQGREASHLRQV